MKQRFLATLLAIIILVIPGVVCAEQANASDSILGNDSGKHMVDQLSQSLRWTLSSEVLVFNRVGIAKETLVERVPGDVHFYSIPTTPGTQALNSTDFDQGFSPGFRVGAVYHVDSNNDMALSFFRIAEWGSSRSIGPDDPLNWLVMRAPGGFFQTQDFVYQSMTWKYSTQLYSAEANMQKKISDRITILAGFRWLQLNESLEGTIPPSDIFQPTWKAIDPTLFEVAEIATGIGAPGYPPFWTTSTTNNLYGLQIGADAKLFERGRFSLNGLIKVGEYWNHASEYTDVSIAKVVYNSGASTDQPTFVSEAGLQCKYQITKGVALKLGYQALWLNGVALAPGQIEKTYSTSAPVNVNALGVNSDSDVLFHGVTAGLEFSF